MRLRQVIDFEGTNGVRLPLGQGGGPRSGGGESGVVVVGSGGLSVAGVPLDGEIGETLVQTMVIHTDHIMMMEALTTTEMNALL